MEVRREGGRKQRGRKGRKKGERELEIKREVGKAERKGIERGREGRNK